MHGTECGDLKCSLDTSEVGIESVNSLFLTWTNFAVIFLLGNWKL